MATTQAANDRSLPPNAGFQHYRSLNSILCSPVPRISSEDHLIHDADGGAVEGLFLGSRRTLGKMDLEVSKSCRANYGK